MISPSFRHPRTPGRPLRTLLAAMCIPVLALSGCGVFGNADQHSQGGQAPDQQTQNSPQTPAEPEIVDDDGYWRANTMPEPVAQTVVHGLNDDGAEASARLEVLSLDADAESARLVYAWLPAVSGETLSVHESTSAAGSLVNKPWVKLADFDSRELIEPYRSKWANSETNFDDPPQAEDLEPEAGNSRPNDCACSHLALDPSKVGEQPDEITLMYADFPKPASANVTLQFGENGPVLNDVPVSTGQVFTQPELTSIPFQTLKMTELPAVYGAGADGQRRVPFDVITSMVSDASVSEKGDASALNVNSDVLFEFDKDTLNAQAQKTLDSVVAELKKSASGQEVTIEGHTDDEGSDSYNQDLSERRAEAVRKAIEPQLGGTGITLKTQGFGETQPILPNRDASGQAIAKNQEKNRRVSFSYTPVQDMGSDIDTGTQTEDLPEMDSVDNPDALASGILPGADEDNTPDVTFDILSLEEQGDFYKLSFALSAADGSDLTGVYQATGSGEKADRFQFGFNPWTNSNNAPSGLNLQLWDKDSGFLADVVTAGPGECLCSQAMRINNRPNLYAAPTQMYAYFPKKSIDASTLTLRVADTAQLEFKRS